MPTLKQKRLAQNIIEAAQKGETPPLKVLVANSGYGRTMQKAHPGETISRKGTKKALEEFGFSEEIAKKVVGDILTNEKTKAKDRLTAADMTFKVHGTYAAEKRINLNIDVEIEGIQEIEMLMPELKKRILESYDGQPQALTGNGETGHSHLVESIQDKNGERTIIGFEESPISN